MYKRIKLYCLIFIVGLAISFAFFAVSIMVSYNLTVSLNKREIFFSPMDIFLALVVCPFVLTLWKPKDLIFIFNFMIFFIASIFIGLYANSTVDASSLTIDLYYKNVLNNAFNPDYILGYALFAFVCCIYILIIMAPGPIFKTIKTWDRKIYTAYFKFKSPIFRALANSDFEKLNQFSNVLGGYKDPVWYRNLLHWSVILKNEQAVIYLLEKAPTLLHKEDHDGYRPLDYATKESGNKILKALLTNEASIFHKSDYKKDESFISEAMLYEDIELLKFIFENMTASKRREQIVDLQQKNKDWIEGVQFLQSQIINIESTRI